MARPDSRTASGTGAKVTGVAPGGIAAAVGLEPGDVVAGVDGRPVRDILDYQYLTFPDRIRLRVVKPGGEEWDVAVEKDAGEPLGVTLAGEIYDGVRECVNHCFFCFVDQLPPGLRNAIYVKDDDLRLSVLHGNFVTLTNLTQADRERLREQRLSPIRVSIHTTDPGLRALMLGNPEAPPILPVLAELTGFGLEVHGQIVLCPGVNDGKHLEATLQDLLALGPQLRSLAVVPVGVTRYARGGLRPYRPGEAAELLAAVESWRRRYLACGAGQLQCADELFLLAGEEPPPLSYYGEFPQLDNGVGMVRWFTHRWRLATRRLPHVVTPRRVLVLTGRLFAPWLRREMARLSGVAGLTVEVRACDNELFGPSVTVAGLLGGGDLLRGCQQRRAATAAEAARTSRGGDDAAGEREEAGWDQVLVPPEVLRSEGDLTLDGWSLESLARRLGIPVSAPPAPRDMARAVLGLPRRKAVGR